MSCTSTLQRDDMNHISLRWLENSRSLRYKLFTNRPHACLMTPVYQQMSCVEDIKINSFWTMYVGIKLHRYFRNKVGSFFHNFAKPWLPKIYWQAKNWKFCETKKRTKVRKNTYLSISWGEVEWGGIKVVFVIVYDICTVEFVEDTV